MIKIGITGGIGSGKSVVASLLALSGVPVYIADEESKWLTNNSPVIREKLTALFGPEIYTNEGLNKKLLASHIFNNPKQLQQVNQIIHPEVNRHFSAWVERQTSPLCAIESASLMVYAPRELRIERALGRDSASREEIERRINSQMSDEEKKDRSDYVIYNDNRQALIPQVGKLLCWLQSQ